MCIIIRYNVQWKLWIKDNAIHSDINYLHSVHYKKCLSKWYEQWNWLRNYDYTNETFFQNTFLNNLAKIVVWFMGYKY